MTKQQLFFDKYANYAMQTQNLFGVPASVTLAQAALESGWGESGLTKNANNFFGIKVSKGWTGESYNTMTGEVFNGQSVMINSNFRKYKTPLDSFNDHAIFLIKNSNYKNLFALDLFDYKGWCNGLKAAGYATATNYAQTLITMIEKYDLTKYDRLAGKKKIGQLIFVCLLTTGLCFGFAYYKKYLDSKRNIFFTSLIGVTLGIVINALYINYQKNKLN